MKKLLCLLPLSFCTSCAFDCQEYLQNEVRNRAFKGIVIEKFRREQEHGRRYLRIDEDADGKGEAYSFQLASGEKIWEYAQIGDSLVKHSNDLHFRLFRNGRETMFEIQCGR